MIYTFFSSVAVGFSGAVMPGSLLTYTIRKSLSRGPKAGFIIIAGHALLELALIVLIFLGFDTVLQSDIAQLLISFIGGALLIYMGIDMIRGSIKNSVSVHLDEKTPKTGNMFLSGIVISAMNPYFLLWWAVIGLGFIMQAYNSFGLVGIAVYYLGHISADFIWYGFISTVVGTTRKFIKEKPYRIIIAFLGCLLIFFGGKFVFSAIMSYFTL
jgi:threonine/homoserine/homoserine lactone efflux protein